MLPNLAGGRSRARRNLGGADADDATNHVGVGGDVAVRGAVEGQAVAGAVGGGVRGAAHGVDRDAHGADQVHGGHGVEGRVVVVDKADGDRDGGVGQVAAGAAVGGLDDDDGRLGRGQPDEGGGGGDDGGGTHGDGGDGI